jgi:hypothetical protein
MNFFISCRHIWYNQGCTLGLATLCKCGFALSITDFTMHLADDAIITIPLYNWQLREHLLIEMALDSNSNKYINSIVRL